jgi:acetylornithine deacetylase/succinyl-diaminopimelate desuccinylase-like protein
MEALRLVKALGLRPQRTLRCVLFMNEENGLGGGRGYYEAHLDDMDDHVLAIESDRGGFTPRGFVANATDEAMAILRGHVELLADTGALTLHPGGGGADIGPMAASGVPLVGYVPDAQRYFDFHHSERDVFEAIHERELHLGAAAIAGLAWLAANEEQQLLRKDPAGDASH